MAQKQQSKCVAKMSSGPRRGKECGNRVGHGKVFCGHHSKCGAHECLICHESHDLMRLDCGHIYHTHCIDKWFATCGNKKCPYCGKAKIESRIPSRRMTRSQTTNEVTVPIIKEMLDHFESVRGIKNQIKFLIEIFNALNERVVFVKRYDGKKLTKTIRAKMEEFKNDPLVLREELRDELFGVFDQLETNMGWK